MRFPHFQTRYRWRRNYLEILNILLFTGTNCTILRITIRIEAGKKICKWQVTGRQKNSLNCKKKHFFRFIFTLKIRPYAPSRSHMSKTTIITYIHV
jgi:hypothetical protein